MTTRDGWTPGSYEIAQGTRAPDGTWEQCDRTPVVGEVWGPFGMTRYQWYWTVTHRPTGMAIADFERKAEAKRFCKRIASLADWPTLDGKTRMPDDFRMEVQRAMDECNAVSLVRIL